jgi:hypothetical protein
MALGFAAAGALGACGAGLAEEEEEPPLALIALTRLQFLVLTTIQSLNPIRKSTCGE